MIVLTGHYSSMMTRRQPAIYRFGCRRCTNGQISAEHRVFFLFHPVQLEEYLMALNIVEQVAPTTEQ